MAKLSDIFPEESGTAATADQRIESLEKRVDMLEEMIRQLYQSGDQTTFAAPQKRPRRRTQ